MIKKVLNGYTIEKHLGEGGMADVYYATNPLGIAVAIKVLKKKFSDEKAVYDRFIEEAKIMVSLKHENIRKALNIGELDGRPAIIMEYLEGHSLKELIEKGNIVDNDHLNNYFKQCLNALNYTGQNQIIHRDIKPSNIFITNDKEVKILDFGIAKSTEGMRHTQTGQTLGTIVYMSPEQVKDPKRITYKSDLYSLAVSFYHALTGNVPYDLSTESDYTVQTKIVNEPLDLDDISEEWKHILSPYLDKDPEKRSGLFDPDMTMLVTDKEKTTVPAKHRQSQNTQEVGSSINTIYNKYIAPYLMWYGLGLAILIFTPYFISSDEECTDYRIKTIIAQFSETDDQGLSNSILTKLEKKLPDTTFAVRTSSYQDRNIENYTQFIKDTFFNNACNATGLYVNGYKNDKTKIFNVYIENIGLRIFHPDYLSKNKIVLDNPLNISFQTKKDAEFLSDFIALLLLNKLRDNKEGLRANFEFQKRHKLTFKNEARYDTNSILPYIYLMRANHYAAEGDDVMAQKFYDQSIKKGNREIVEIATINKIKATKIAQVMKEDPELKIVRKNNLKKHRKIESDFEKLLREIGEVLEKIIKSIFK